MRRMLVDPWRTSTRMREWSQYKATDMPYTVDFSSAASDRGTTVSSVSWSSEGSQQVTFANQDLTSGVASADISSIWSGNATVKVTATYADGNTEAFYFKVRVKDPDNRN